MQKFSEFVEDYKTWKSTNKKTSELTTAEVKKLRGLYESMNSKKSKMVESNDFNTVLEQYREWKLENKGTRGVTLKEKELLKSKLNKKVLHESEENGRCDSCGVDEKDFPLYTVKEYLDQCDEKDYKDLDPKDVIDAINEKGYAHDITEDSTLCEDCILNGCDAVLDSHELTSDDIEKMEQEEIDDKADIDMDGDMEFEESIEGFKTIVTKYREWKKANHGTSKLTENEKTVLKAKFLEKCSHLNESKEVTKDTRLQEAIAQYKEWKKANHGTDEVTAFEESTIAKNLMLDDVKAKLEEAKKFVESGKKHLKEGDMMDAGADANAAAGAVNDATAMVADPNADPNAAPADPNAAGAPLPQNIVDEISQIKTSIDSLATECGIESPVDLGADANAGVPAVTGAADPNVDASAAPDAGAAPADPNAAPAPDAGAAPMPESIKSVRARIAERNKALKETAKFSNTAFRDDAKEDMVKVPSESELISGTKSGIAKAAEWPVSKVEPKDSKKLKNIEESQEELAKRTLDEDGEFSWAAYTKMLKNM